MFPYRAFNVTAYFQAARNITGRKNHHSTHLVNARCTSRFTKVNSEFGNPFRLIVWRFVRIQYRHGSWIGSLHQHDSNERTFEKLSRRYEGHFWVDLIPC